RAAFATPVVILLALDLQSSLLARQALLKEGDRALLIHHISHLGRLLFACWILRILAMELRIDGDCKERLPDFLIRFRICCTRQEKHVLLRVKSPRGRSKIGETFSSQEDQ